MEEQAKLTGSSKSFWIDQHPLQEAEPLKEDCDADLCVIGGGIAGLTSAYLLSKSGKKVVLIDDGYIGGGQTTRSTGHLATALDDRYFELEKFFGTEGAKLAAESHRAAIEFIDKLVHEESIECDFHYLDAYLFTPPGDDKDVLRQEMEAARRAGLHDVELVPRAPFTTFDTGQSLRFPRQASFHPQKYINQLYSIILRQGCRVYTAHVDSIEKKNGKFHLLTDERRSASCRELIVATNSPVDNRYFPHLKQAAYRTYVIAGPIPKGSVVDALYYDTPDPYHYIRIAPLNDKEDMLIVGGEDHRTGEYPFLDMDRVYSNLESWTKERFPQYSQSKFKWSGQIIEPVDSLAFIGRGSENHIYIATGDSGNGLTHGTIAGILLSDLILGKKNPWEKLYDPHRISLKSWQEFSEENLNTLKQYGDWILPGEVESIAEIPLGSGAIIRDELKKIAVYKDLNGEIVTLSATCPHLNGIVRWNALERTWDCPCHGSCFSCDGKVIQGPAISNLEIVDIKETAGKSR